MKGGSCLFIHLYYRTVLETKKAPDPLLKAFSLIAADKYFHNANMGISKLEISLTPSWTKKVEITNLSTCSQYWQNNLKPHEHACNNTKMQYIILSHFMRKCINDNKKWGYLLTHPANSQHHFVMYHSTFNGGKTYIGTLPEYS